MQLGVCKRMHAPLAAARAWPLWELPRWLTGYIVAIVVAYLAVLSVVGQFYTLSPRQIVILGALILCGAATVELTKRSGENAGLISDIYGVWELPIAILLPLGYAMLVPVIRLGLTQWRIRRVPLYRRVFTAAIIGLSYAASGALFHALSHTGFESVPSPLDHPTAWVLAIAAAALMQWLVNTTLLLPAVISLELIGETTLPADLFRIRLDRLKAPSPVFELEIVSEADVPLAGNIETRFVVMRGGPAPRDQVAVLVGRPDPAKPVPVRVHSACLTGDMFGSLRCDCGDQLRNAIARLNADGGGVLLYLDQEGRGIGLGNKMRAYSLQDDGFDTIDANSVLGFEPDERRYEYAAAMLAKLSYRRIVLLTNNPDKVEALGLAGIEVVGRQPLTGTPTVENSTDYLIRYTQYMVQVTLALHGFGSTEEMERRVTTASGNVEATAQDLHSLVYARDEARTYYEKPIPH